MFIYNIKIFPILYIIFLTIFIIMNDFFFVLVNYSILYNFYIIFYRHFYNLSGHRPLGRVGNLLTGGDDNVLRGL